MPQLDALRAFAVASVAYAHWVSAEYHYGIAWGTAGVQLFFVLSGFLISAILLRCRDRPNRPQALCAFYARRCLRILPLFYGIVAIAYFENIGGIRNTIFWHALYLSNFYFFAEQEFAGPLSHFWSLAVEEQFYLFWPMVVLFAPRRALLPSFVTLTTVGVLSRILLPVFFPEIKLFGVLPNSNFDALGLGALLALRNSDPDEINLRIEYTAIGIPVALVVIAVQASGISSDSLELLSRFSMLLCFLWLIDGAARGFEGTLGKLLTSPILIYLGRISYGLYLLHNFAHIPVRIACDTIGYPSLRFGTTGFLLKAIVTIFGATVSWTLFEAPLNSLKDRFPYSPSPNEAINAS